MVQYLDRQVCLQRFDFLHHPPRYQIAVGRWSAFRLTSIRPFAKAALDTTCRQSFNYSAFLFHHCWLFGLSLHYIISSSCPLFLCPFSHINLWICNHLLHCRFGLENMEVRFIPVSCLHLHAVESDFVRLWFCYAEWLPVLVKMVSSSNC